MMFGLQARLPEIEQLSKELNARTEELSDVRFKLEEDKATASAAQVTFHATAAKQITASAHCRLISL